jgi:hypothetical protein
MKTILDLIAEANRICYAEATGACTADGVLAALAILEAGRKTTGREFMPATADAVAEYFDGRGKDATVCSTGNAYQVIYGREGNTAELRTMASALRASGWVPYRSNGRTMWRRRDVTRDGLYGIQNAPEIARRISEWAAAQPHFRDTAANIFRRVMEREPTLAETKAVGAVLREAGCDVRKNNGRLLFSRYAVQGA